MNHFLSHFPLASIFLIWGISFGRWIHLDKTPDFIIKVQVQLFSYIVQIIKGVQKTMTENKVRVLLVGINGYGVTYLREMLSGKYADHARLVGVTSTNPKRSEYYNELVEQEIPIYSNIEEFFKHAEADLTIISTPIHLHKDHTIHALNNGSHVLCEKPITANPADIKEMIEARDRSGKFVAIGFNWSFAEPTQKLKEDVLAGKFGKAIRAKTCIFWPRNEDYYDRSGWAGKMYSDDGDYIFDSVANNATAHFLHHILYVTGDRVDTSSSLKELTAELYKVNDIETFDTCVVDLQTDKDFNILYIASHAVHESRRPVFEIEFEKGLLTYNPEEDDRGMIMTLNDSSTIVYGDPEPDANSKIPVCIQAAYHQTDDILCGIEASTPHVLSIQAMHQSVPEIPRFPEEISLRDNERKLNHVQGLEEVLDQCYEEWTTPSELKVDWSKQGKKISL